MQLYVKLDHVAGLRSAGGGREPEPSIAASLAELEGAKGITLHLHSDRATVQLRDIRVLLETLSIPLNLELSISTKNRQHAFDLRPAAITLVREPMDVKADRWPLEVEDKGGVASFIEALKEADIPNLARAACHEAHTGYPVPRYLTQQGCEDLIRLVLPPADPGRRAAKPAAKKTSARKPRGSTTSN